MVLSLLVFIPPQSHAAPTVTITNGSCTGSEICIFTINSTQNAHVGSCGYYGTTVCANFTTSVVDSDACQPGNVETSLLALSQPNDTHVGQFGLSSFQSHVCVTPVQGVTVRLGSCGVNEACLISLNGTDNSHVGSCGYYGYSLCVGPPDTAPPTVAVQSPSNSSYSTASVWANITVSEVASSVMRSLDGGSNVTMTNSSGGWNSQLTGLSEGPHRVTFYVNDTSNNFAAPQTVFFTVDSSPVIISVASPTNATYSDGEITAVLQLNKAVSACYSNLDGGGNVTMTNSSGGWNSQLSAGYIGSHNVVFYCDDNSGRSNVTSPVFFTVTGDTIVITGSSLYSSTGTRISSGTITGTILETGDSNSTSVGGQDWSLAISSLRSLDDSVSNVGLRVTDSSGKSGYYAVRVGSGEVSPASDECSANTFRFTGTVANAFTGSSSGSGTVGIDVEGTAYTNSTSYSNGLWDVGVSGCLVTGRVYTFNVKLRGDDGSSGLVNIRQVAK